MMPKHLNFITGNKHKLGEVKAILGDVVHLESQALDLIEIQGTIEEIILDKCKRAADQIGGPVLVEDTCMSFNAWGELPGPYVKWFVKQFGPDGLYKLLEGFHDKSAQAICTFAFCEGPGHPPKIFQGRTEGRIVPARGPRDFGWDSAFEYNGQTYAEMDKSKKNEVSHRGKALMKLKNWLNGVDGDP